MREIKFRACRKTKMFSWREISEPRFNRCGNPSCGMAYGLLYKCLELNEITLMQYTGLKDKNGKEIYEGDILNFNNRKNTPVVWWKQTGCWGTPDNPLGLAAKMSEIIGNIYENPDLLEKP